MSISVRPISVQTAGVTLNELDLFDVNDVNYYGAQFTKPPDKVYASRFNTAKDSTLFEMAFPK